MKSARLLLVLLACTLGCSDVESRTKITFVIEASQALQRETSRLRVFVRSERGDAMRTFERAEIPVWPVEIVVIPEEGNDSAREVTLTARAYNQADTELAVKTATASFSAEKQRVVPVALVSTSIVEEPSTVVDGGTAEGGAARPDESPDDGDDEPGSDDPPGADGPSEPPDEDDDGGMSMMPEPGPVGETCASPGSRIRCDDGNPCNGVERCDPPNGAAIENGCVGGTMVACADGTTCNPETGVCSACGTRGDGDGDGVKSISCGGTDCNDGDPAIAPGKPELCDARDNDCDGVTDGTAADPSCASRKPTGGTASCVAGACKVGCTNPAHVIEDGACVAPVTTCPTPNPCAPGGTCKALAMGYECTCDAGHRAGVGTASLCAGRGTPARTLGFETDCANVVLDGFVAGAKAIGSDFYAGCGISTIVSGGMLMRPQIVQPALAIEGMKGSNALLGVESELSFSFAPAVTDFAFDVLDVDNPMTLQVTTEPASAAPIAPVMAAGSKVASYKHHSMTPITRVVIKYTPMTAMDAWYVDTLNFFLKGCGDAVVDVGEECDDGDSLQCNGCDNACKRSPNGCLMGNSCAMGMPAMGSLTGACAP